MILDEISMIGANALWEMHIGLQVACDEGEHARAQDGAAGHLASLKKTRATPRVTRAHIPTEYKALFSSQKLCVKAGRPKKEKAELAAVATVGCIMLDDAPDSIMRHYNIVAMESLLECLREGRGHLRLQGLTHVQGGFMVLEPFANVLQFSEPLRNLERACFEHCRHLLEDVVGNKVGPFL